jgi:hypothetical protein
VAAPRKENKSGDFVVRGLILGYVYSIFLSTSGIVVCELRNKSDCNSAWSQGYAIATGLVTTFLAYFVQPPSKAESPRMKVDSNASES